MLGITGGIACGKSEVGRILGEMGFAVCDADQVAHDLMGKGTPVYRQVVDHFGTRIVSVDGEIARPILGEIVFENPQEREALNGMVHPAVRDRLAGWIAEQRGLGANAAVLVPLLFESGMDTLDWDAVICVSSPEKQVFHRLEKRGMGHIQAEQRVRSQMLLAEKEKRADLVVPNQGTLGELKESIRNAVANVMAERAGL
ncbi:MAG: dephospho-CoA kinase [Kiritimatiellales bacterium]|nr:dephospho-CoA kinase [Kiritimatiellales bacterium]